MNDTRFSLFGKVVSIAYVVIFLIITLTLLGQVLSAKFNIIYYYSDIRIIDQVDYQVNDVDMGTLHLPATIKDLQPEDRVTITVNINARPLDDLLVKTNKVKMRLYVNDEVYYTIGNPGTYPTFQHEPSVAVAKVSLPRTPDVLELRFEYQISDIANSLELPAYYDGDSIFVNDFVMSQNILSFIIAILIVILGLILTTLGLAFYHSANLAISLFWLGLALVCCGLWTFCANDLTLLLFSNYTLFYNLSYIGMFLMPLPLIRFGIVMLRENRSIILEIGFWLFALIFLVTIISQLAGILSFSTVEPIIYAVDTVMMAVYLVVLLVIRFYRHAKISSAFVFANVILFILAAAEGLNRVFHFVNSVGLLFQFGLLFDAAVVSVLVWAFLVDAFEAAEKNAKLEVEVAATNRSLSLQRTLYENFTSSAEEIRKLRHDIRHQLFAVRGMIADGKDDEAEQYIDKLYGNIPSIVDQLICDNIAVNALAIHYLAQAKAAGIQCDLRLEVPLEVGRVPDNDLSVIVGNLLENAIEACMHVDAQKRFIKVRSSINKSRFTFTIDNSYDGKLDIRGQEFYSRKRNGKGIGIASVKTVVLKYEGSMKYEAQDGVFKTSLYVKI